MKKYIVATAAALVVALAVYVSRSTPAIGGEWLMAVMAPGGVWVWEDMQNENM
ncbi:hypothetical protein SAMN04515656_1039 [Eubacterium aggregans]|uniref:Uncharacterized protein n=1 Tax=Eubacterium aggregans TaxID=81409 RepID=A0A1H3Y0B3_9FIRM|nr:hypothetical protein [Eubacterium aggregans]SEA05046.1 hypothetical protein SAMN04515656_1039 [Eubacterium aggregans]